MKNASLIIFYLLLNVIPNIGASQDLNLFQYFNEHELSGNILELSNLNMIKKGADLSQVYLIKALRTEQLRDSKSITINLPFISVISRVKYIKSDSPEHFIWVGRLEGIDGSVLLDVTAKNITGMIHIADTVYSIKPIGKEYHALILIDQSKYCKDGNKKDYGIHAPNTTNISKSSNNHPKIGQLSKSGSIQTDPIIDIMIVYTPAAAASSGNMISLINGCISTTNNICANSGVTPRVRLVYYNQIDYAESGYLETDVIRLQGQSEGYMDNIHALRDQYGADIVVLLVATGDNYGYAYEIETAASGAFAVAVIDGAVDNYSFAHEVSHLIGGYCSPSMVQYQS